MDKAKCRICLAEDVRMHFIANTYLQDTYEKLTTKPLVTKDNRSLQVCYICCARLRNCHQLRTRCLQSEEFFTQLLENNCLDETSVKDARCTLKTYQIVNISITESPKKLGAALETEPVLINIDVQVKEEPTEVTEDNSDQNVFCPAYTTLEDINITDDVSSEHKDVLIDDHTLQITENFYEIEIDTKHSIPATHPGPQLDHLREFVNINMKDNFKSVHSIRSAEMFNNVCPKAVQIVLNRIDFDHIKTSVTADRNQELAEYKQVNKSTLSGEPETNVKIEQNNNGSYKEQTIENSIITKYNENIVSTNYNGLCKCETCGKCFDQKYKLKRHSYIHTAEKPYTCNICEKGFIEKHRYKSHVLLHTGEKPYKCDKCNKGFMKDHDLKVHMRMKCMLKPYKCDICEKSFSYQSSLSVHTQIHTDEKPYKCEVCEKRFSVKLKLRMHKFVHSGKKQHICDICRQGFSGKAVLRRHLLIHTGEKPYKCNKCKKCFKENHDLKVHTRMQCISKPYKCNFCEKSYGYLSNLIVHTQIHTGKKPHKCDLCDKRFSVKYGLRRHMLTHTDEKP